MKTTEVVPSDITPPYGPNDHLFSHCIVFKKTAFGGTSPHLRCGHKNGFETVNHMHNTGEGWRRQIDLKQGNNIYYSATQENTPTTLTPHETVCTRTNAAPHHRSQMSPKHHKKGGGTYTVTTRNDSYLLVCWLLNRRLSESLLYSLGFDHFNPWGGPSISEYNSTIENGGRRSKRPTLSIQRPLDHLQRASETEQPQSFPTQFPWAP